MLWCVHNEEILLQQCHSYGISAIMSQLQLFCYATGTIMEYVLYCSPRCGSWAMTLSQLWQMYYTVIQGVVVMPCHSDRLCYITVYVLWCGPRCGRYAMPFSLLYRRCPATHLTLVDAYTCTSYFRSFPSQYETPNFCYFGYSLCMLHSVHLFGGQSYIGKFLANIDWFDRCSIYCNS